MVHWLQLATADGNLRSSITISCLSVVFITEKRKEKEKKKDKKINCRKIPVSEIICLNARHISQFPIHQQFLFDSFSKL